MVGGNMDWHEWIRQSLPRTEKLRGGAAVWEVGAQGLTGDTLGPVMHLHDGASEIFYFVAGKCRLEVGDSEETFQPGDFVLVPPGVPHNLWNAADEDLLVFWIVAPHLPQNKWRTESITAGDMGLRATRTHLESAASLPGDANIHSQLVMLQAGEDLAERTGESQEGVLYVASGQAQVKVGKLGGILLANEFVHVPVDTAYSAVSLGGAASILVFQTPAN
jgi:mannose-6-phosphate isomerase-like protein (cupin superfamily)